MYQRGCLLKPTMFHDSWLGSELDFPSLSLSLSLTTTVRSRETETACLPVCGADYVDARGIEPAQRAAEFVGGQTRRGPRLQCRILDPSCRKNAHAYWP